MIKDVTITSNGDFQSITFSREENSNTIDMSFHYPRGCGYASFSLEDMKMALRILAGGEKGGKSVAEQIEEVCQDICDNYCIYRDTCDENAECEPIREGKKCPLDRLM